MIRDKKVMYGVVGAVALAIAAMGILTMQRNDEAEKPAHTMPDEVHLYLDEGLNQEYSADGMLVISERYRFLDERIDGSNKTVNISEENARVVLRDPSGREQDITSELWFVPVEILPSPMTGQYEVVATLHSGDVYAEAFTLHEPQEVGLHAIGQDSFLLGELDLREAHSPPHVFPLVEGTDSPRISEDGVMVFDTSALTEGMYTILVKINNIWYYSEANYPEDF